MTDNGNHRIQKFTNTGTFITKWGVEGSGIGQFNNPMGIAVDSSTHEVYVTDQFNRIQKFKMADSCPKGTLIVRGVCFVTEWTIYNHEYGLLDVENPTFDIAVNPSTHDVYVTDNLRAIQKFTSSDTLIKEIFSPNAIPSFAICVGPSGEIYASNAALDIILKYTSNLDYVNKWGSKGIGNGQFNEPLGIAVDSSGQIFVTDAGNNNVQMFIWKNLNPPGITKSQK